MYGHYITCGRGRGRRRRADGGGGAPLPRARLAERAAGGRPSALEGRGGARARSYCRFYSTAHPLYTIFANICGTSISEATMRPDPRWRSTASDSRSGGARSARLTARLRRAPTPREGPALTLVAGPALTAGPRQPPQPSAAYSGNVAAPRRPGQPAAGQPAAAPAPAAGGAPKRRSALDTLIHAPDTCPGHPGALKRPQRFLQQISFVWRFCMGAQVA